MLLKELLSADGPIHNTLVSIHPLSILAYPGQGVGELEPISADSE